MRQLFIVMLAMPLLASPSVAATDPNSEDALFERATGLEKAGDYERALDAWKQVESRYDGSEGASIASVRIGVCYWHMGRAEERHVGEGTADSDLRKSLFTEAQKAFDKAGTSIVLRKIAGKPVSATTEKMLVKARFWAADSSFICEEYGEALRRYSTLEIVSNRRPEELIALSQQWQCHYRLGEWDKAGDVALRMKARIRLVDFEAGDKSLETSKPEFWEAWVKRVESDEPP